MSKFVVLVLDGTHQQWSDQGVGFVRMGRPFPTRSGVGGLIAAALGLQRTDSRIDGLQAGIRVSSRILKEGTTRKEYQNIRLSDPSPKTGDVPYGDHTFPRQVWRWYLVDAAFQVAVEVLPSCPFSADEILAALKTPAMPLYLGRKYCRLSFPPVGPDCSVVEAEDLRVAFRKPWNEGLRRASEDYIAQGAMFFDTDDVEQLPHGCVPIQVGDVVLSNKARSFTTRFGYLWKREAMS